MSKLQVLCLLLLGLSLQLVEGKVKLVLDVIRHGARAGTHNLPYFPNITWSQTEILTAVGERQHNLLGRLRRTQYIEQAKLLPEVYDPSLLSVRTSDVTRTFMSAQSYLLGLYPTGLTKLNPIQTKYVDKLLVPPIELRVSQEVIARLKDNAIPMSVPMIPIMSVNGSVETLIHSESCDLVMASVMGYFSSTQYQQLIQELYKETWLTIMLEYPTITWDVLLQGIYAFVIADFVVCADRDGRRPARIQPEIVQQLRGFIYQALAGIDGMNPLLNKISNSAFTSEASIRMNQTIEGLTRVKYALYSAHDATLVFMISGLNKINSSIHINHVPDFASNLLFELNGPEDSKSPSAHYVSVYHNGSLIHNDSYTVFQPAFAAIGNIGMSREEACRVRSSSKPPINLETVQVLRDYFGLA